MRLKLTCEHTQILTTTHYSRTHINTSVHPPTHTHKQIVLLCVFCHQTAHKSADQVKRALAREFNVPFHPTLLLRDGEAAPGVGDEEGEEGGGGGAVVGPDGSVHVSEATLAAARREALARNARHAAIALFKSGGGIPEPRWVGALVLGRSWNMDW